MGTFHQRRPSRPSAVVYDSPETFLSPTPILQPQQAPLYVPRTASTSTTADKASLLISQTIQQLPRPSITIPAAACVLFLLNHIGALFRLVYSLGFIDCVAIMCLVASGILATQHLRIYLRKAAQNLVVQVLEMTDSKKTLHQADGLTCMSTWLVTSVGCIKKMLRCGP